MIFIRRFFVDLLATLGISWLLIEIFDFFFSDYSNLIKNDKTFLWAIIGVLIISLISASKKTLLFRNSSPNKNGFKIQTDRILIGKTNLLENSQAQT